MTNLDPAKTVFGLTIRAEGDKTYCGECNSLVVGSEAGVIDVGVIDDSSPDPRDWRKLGEPFIVLLPCGHNYRGSLVQTEIP